MFVACSRTDIVPAKSKSFAIYDNERVKEAKKVYSAHFNFLNKLLYAISHMFIFQFVRSLICRKQPFLSDQSGN